MTDEEIAKKIALHDQELKQHSEDIKEITKRQDDMDKLVTTVAVIANKQENMSNDIGEIKSDVKALTDKPAERWDGLMDKVVSAVVGAFLVWVATGMPGLN